MKGQDAQFMQRLSKIIVQQQEHQQQKTTTTQLKQVRGVAGIEQPKVVVKKAPPQLQEPNEEQPRHRLSHKLINQKTPVSKQSQFSYQSDFFTPRASKIKFRNYNNLNAVNNYQLEQGIVSRISNDMKNSGHASRPSIQNYDLVKVARVQAIFRRRRVQKLYIRLLKTNRYRTSVYNELVKTEEIYLQDIKTIYSLLVMETKRQRILSDQEIQRCFLNIGAIIELNERMLHALRANQWHPHKQMIKSMLDYAPFFKIYFEYCNNYQSMCTQIEKFKRENVKYHRYTSNRFMQLFKEVSRNPKLRNMDIESFLVKPVQRLPKYVLLLKDYLKHTDAEHVDYMNIQLALQMFNKVNDENNKHMDRVVVNAKMFELQKSLGDTPGVKIVDPKRDFLLEEPMTVFLRNQPKSVLVYFFSDLVLVTERELQSSTIQQQRLLAPLFISEQSSVKDLADSHNFKNIFSLIGENETITFQAFDESAKKRIMQVIEEMIQKLQEKTYHIMRKPSEQRIEAYQKLQKSSVQPRRRKWKIEVEVLGSEERQGTMSSYTIYVIEVGIEGIVCKVFMRFSEFNELQVLTRKSFPRVNVPFGSEKQFFGNHDSKVIEARKMQIQNFLQTLLGNPDFYGMKRPEDVATVLKFIGLPQNFYELPSLLTNYEQQCNEDEELSQFDKQLAGTKLALASESTNIERPSHRRASIKAIQQGKSIPMMQGLSKNDVDQVQRINTHLIAESRWQNKTIIDLPRPDELFTADSPRKPEPKQQEERLTRSMTRGNSAGSRRVSATKLLQSTSVKKDQPTQQSFTLQVKLSTMTVELPITDESRAMELAEIVAERIGLLQHYDFKFVDEKSGRYVQDDELLLAMFGKKEDKPGILSKVLHNDRFSILFRKVLYLPKMLETYECHLDNVRLRLLVGQLMADIMNLNKVSMSFKEYCTVAALQIFILCTESKARVFTFEQVAKYVPLTLLKATKKETWMDQVAEIVQRFRLDLDHEQLSPEMQVITALRVMMNMAQQIKHYGLTLYPAENVPENKFNKTIPAQVLIGISIEGVHVMDPKKKLILKTFYADRVDAFKVFTNYFQIEILETLDENKVYRFNTASSYQIYQLYEEYQQIQYEIEASQLD